MTCLVPFFSIGRVNRFGSFACIYGKYFPSDTLMAQTQLHSMAAMHVLCLCRSRAVN